MLSGGTGVALDEITFALEDWGWTRVDLRRDGQSISHLHIASLTINVGVARVRVDFIAGVETDEAHRRQGCARLVLDAALARMRAGDAALSILYGIPDFYPKFGYATAGAEYLVYLTGLDRPAPMPSGWAARPLAADDLPAVRTLYERATAEAVGAVQRPIEGWTWSRLAEVVSGAVADDACRVVAGPGGEIEGYAWRVLSHWAGRGLQRDHPDALVIGEAVAAHPVAADAVLAACRAWAVEASAARPEPTKEVLLSFPPEGPLAAAVLRQQARCEAISQPAADFMARTLDVQRLLRALKPELTRRAAAVPLDEAGAVRLKTELGAALLNVRGDGRVDVASDGAAADAATVDLPQTELMRLALGVFPPADVLNRLPMPPSAQARRLVEALFPRRHPYIHLPDRV